MVLAKSVVGLRPLLLREPCTGTSSGQHRDHRQQERAQTCDLHLATHHAHRLTLQHACEGVPGMTTAIVLETGCAAQGRSVLELKSGVLDREATTHTAC